MSGYERTDAHVGTLARVGLALVLLIVVSLAAMFWAFRYLAAPDTPRAEVSEFARQRVVPVAPRLQVTPSADLDRLRRSQQSALTGYGWVDRRAGVVRIPIERAIELLVAREQARRAGKP